MAHYPVKVMTMGGVKGVTMSEEEAAMREEVKAVVEKAKVYQYLVENHDGTYRAYRNDRVEANKLAAEWAKEGLDAVIYEPVMVVRPKPEDTPIVMTAIRNQREV